MKNEVIILDDTTGLAIGTTARVYMVKTSDKSEIMSKATDAAGSSSFPYSYIVDVDVEGWSREMSLT